MKFKDIVYKLQDEVIAPDKMGVVATDLMDWSTNCKCYAESIPAVEKATEICSGFHLEDEVSNIISDELPVEGFCKRHVFFFIIEVPEDTHIVYYPYIPDSDHRHWHNGELAFIGNSLSVYTITLKKGYNIFCVEKFTDISPFVRIQKKDESDNLLLSFTENNYFYKPSNFEVAHNRHITNNEPFEFTLIPLDLINLSFESIVKMTIRLGENGQILYEESVSFKQAYKMDLSFIPNMGEDEGERLYVYFHVEDKKGITIEQYTILFRHEIKQEYIEDLKCKASCLLDKNHVPELVKNEIRFCMSVLTEPIANFYFGKHLKQILESEKNNNLDDYLFQPGAHNIYYYSKINNQYHHYYIVLPKDFDPNKKYPLILTVQYGNVNDYDTLEHTINYSARFANREGAIYADIGGDGCTMGSYIGELFLLTEIEHILKNFPVDKKRVYAIANCAGNIASFNIAGAYPHLFAGIYTRGVDIPKNWMKNLHNVHCMFVYSGKNREILKDTKLLKMQIKNVDFLYANKYYDRFIELIYLQYTKPAIDLLMSAELDEFPETIHYSTTRNRARRGYYIEIESIKKGKYSAEFSSKIVENSLIIRTKNCTGLKIILPPQIDREFFVIEINGKPFEFIKYSKEEVLFKHITGKGFRVVDSFKENICYYKGTGLLDVYMSPMRAVNCDFQEEKLTYVTNVYANPKTNTTVGLNISYPVISIDEIINYTDYSLIVVDNNCKSNETLDLIRSLFPIQTDKKGYSYKGAEILGDYCIVQVIANPWNKEKSILYINANNKELYTKNMFTRKLMIPSYSSGYHPFLNGVVLLFDGIKYYAVREWGDDFIEVK